MDLPQQEKNNPNTNNMSITLLKTERKQPGTLTSTPDTPEVLKGAQQSKHTSFKITA